MRDDDGNPDRDYEVGYGRPPKHTQFKPGQSGNRRGRPKKSKDLAKLIDAELDEIIPTGGSGRRKHMSKREALVKQLVNLAIKGNAKPLQLILAHLEKHREVEPFVPTDADDAALLAALETPDDKESDHGNR